MTIADPSYLRPTTVAPLAVKGLAHPTEWSRLLLAVSSATVALGIAVLLVLSRAGWVGLAIAGVASIVAGASLWLAVQLHRARLLGRAVRVTPETMPELHARLQFIRERLDYRRRLDVYVIDKHEPSAELISYLGSRVLVVEGAVIADLVERDDAQLTFLLARYVGALKAQHMAFTPLEIVLNALESVVVLNPFLLPYYRATVYSGDQIALAVAGSLPDSLRATQRLLCGHDIEPHVPTGGLVAQAGLVRRRLLPRLAQLLAAEPHLTNRYLNLVCYGRLRQPGAWEELQALLPSHTAQEIERLARKSPHRRRPGSPARRAVTGVVALVVTVGLLAAVGLVARPEAIAEADPSVQVEETDTSTPGSVDPSAGRSQPSASIPDADQAGTSDAISIASEGVVDAVTVTVAIDHPYAGDLSVVLVSPSGSEVTLAEPSWETDAWRETTYDATNVPELEDFRGERAAGDWTLRIVDTTAGDEGVLTGWELSVATS